MLRHKSLEKCHVLNKNKIFFKFVISQRRHIPWERGISHLALIFCRMKVSYLCVSVCTLTFELVITY